MKIRKKHLLKSIKEWVPLEDKRPSAEPGTIHPISSMNTKLGLLVSNTLFTRDYDQIRHDLDSPKHLHQYKATKDTEDLPDLGRHYCIECAKWFESENNLVAHTKGKNHKRRFVRQ